MSSLNRQMFQAKSEKALVNFSFSLNQRQNFKVKKKQKNREMKTETIFLIFFLLSKHLQAVPLNLKDTSSENIDSGSQSSSNSILFSEKNEEYRRSHLSNHMNHQREVTTIRNLLTQGKQ